jgi:hypothetical protein
MVFWRQPPFAILTALTSPLNLKAIQKGRGKIMKYLFTVIFATMAMQAFAAGDKLRTHLCYLDVREVRNHFDGPFQGYGRSVEEAKEETLQNCKWAIEAQYPGLCEEYRSKDEAWGCQRTVIYRP